jgi:4-amino-4-deoxy-L-arabinose transferase-like glycosyltransferase
MTVLLSFTLARFFMPFMWSAGTAILVMFSPHMIVMSAYLLTETLFTFTVLLALVLIAASIKVGKTWLYLLSGLTLGASILIRPVIALFPIVCAFIYLVRGGWKVREKLVATLAFLVLSISFQTGSLLWKSKELEGKPPPANEIKNQFLIGSYPDLSTFDRILPGPDP